MTEALTVYSLCLPDSDHRERKDRDGAGCHGWRSTLEMREKTGIGFQEDTNAMNICIVNCFDTWENRVDLLWNVFNASGHNVQVLCSDYCHIEKRKRIEKKPYKLFPAKPYKKNISFSRLRSHIQLSRSIFSYVYKNRNDIDLLWVLAPPNVFIKAGAAIKQRFPELRYVVDLIDLWPEAMPIGDLRKSPVFFLWKNIRNSNLQYADLVVLECNLYKRILANDLDHKKVKTLYIGHKDYGYEPHLNLPADRIGLCYLGSINHIVDIDGIVRVIEQCRMRKSVLLHIIGGGEKERELIQKCRNAGAEVIFYGNIYDRRKKQNIFDQCHYGLNMLKRSVCAGLTMKSVDYLEFGLPIINSIHGDTWEAVRKYGIGINVKDSFEIELQDMRRKRKAARKFFEKFLTIDIFRKNIRDCFACLNVPL